MRGRPLQEDQYTTGAAQQLGGCPCRRRAAQTSATCRAGSSKGQDSTRARTMWCSSWSLTGQWVAMTADAPARRNASARERFAHADLVQCERARLLHPELETGAQQCVGCAHEIELESGELSARIVTPVKAGRRALGIGHKRHASLALP